MGQEEFSDGFRRFVTSNITSVEEIEVLLLLREDPARVWSSEEISEWLRSSPSSIDRRLEALLERRLLRRTQPGFQYAASKGADARIEELKREYQVRRFKVIELVFSGPTNSFKSFADAFLFREEEGDDT